ncbi:protein angel homolog 2-like isoform X1 [Gymnodraco acuticeps]|uniref:Protein angel homolog 2-like isoform X1 n=2 Tax=Gymnodraco acuticeps TaxID=8218 RepID=A0A6P8VD49_GYMAC|nr:protein angel homolog 2-like isoform X1 [Gymnodraco acuticeps]
MHPSRNINDAGPPSEDNSMFFRQLIPAFLPLRPPPLFRSSYTSSSSSSSHFHFRPAPPPWWSAQFPPRPPPPSCHFSSCRTFPPRSVTDASNFRGSRSFSASAGLLMEQSDREPPHKRQKSAEKEEREQKGASNRDRGSKYHPDSYRDPRSNHGDGGRSREDGDGERTKSCSKDRPSDSSRDETANEGRSPSSSRIQSTLKSKPEQDHVSTPKANAWFKERGEEPHSHHPSSAPQSQWPGKPGRPLQRHWQSSSPPCSTEPRPPGSSAEFDFSVMSYNILSQQLLQENIYLYRHCPPAVLSWDYRLPNLLAEIQQHDADILCLQEVQEDHYVEQIKPALQALGYQCEFKKRTGSKPDGCAVIFKSSRLSLLSSNPVEYFQRGDALLDRDNVGLVLLLRPKDARSQSDASSFICVANTHLLYNPRRGDIKLAQLAILLAEINRLSRLPDGSTNPVVLCGDFNSTPRSPLYSFLANGSLKYKGLQSSMVSGQELIPRGKRFLTAPLWSQTLGISPQCQYESSRPPADSSPSVEGAISNLPVEDLASKAAYAIQHRARIQHTLKLHSSYDHLLQDGRPEITTCHSNTATNVDYIMYTPELVPPPSFPGGRGLTLLGRLSLVGQSELKKVNGLPNQNHSSDHLPIFARFRLRR